MNNETKRLAIIGTIFFFPTGLAGIWLYKKSTERAVFLFRLGICVFLALISVAGFLVVTFGGKLIEVIGAFF